jgi:rRNA maturation protein Nop10
VAEKDIINERHIPMFMKNKILNSRTYEYIPLDDTQEYHYSTDIDVAATLLCKGYTLVDIVPVSGTKATFIFNNHPAIGEAEGGFWSNRIEVKPLEFSNARKNLKSRIYAMQKNY